MVYPNHILVAIGGRLGDNEEWQTGFRLISDDKDDLNAQVQRAGENLDDIEAHVLTWWTSCKTSLSAAAHWDFLKVNAIDAAGHYGSQVTNAIYYALDEAGHVGTGIVSPFQNALALSLRTQYTRGRASHGRMYLPIENVSISGSTGQITTGEDLALATATATLFSNINDNPGIDWANTRVAIVSEFGNVNAVTSVRAGKVVDTQRRRRASLVENYGPDQAVTGQGGV